MCAWQEVVRSSPRHLYIFSQRLRVNSPREISMASSIDHPTPARGHGSFRSSLAKSCTPQGQYPLTSAAPPLTVGNICLASVNAGATLGCWGFFEWCDDSCLIWRDAGPQRRIFCKNETGIHVEGFPLSLFFFSKTPASRLQSCKLPGTDATSGTSPARSAMPPQTAESEEEGGRLGRWSSKGGQ